MKFLDLTLPTPAENLACDEALADCCNESGDCEVLRFWEPQGYFAVVGYANRVATEVNLSACEANHIPVLRRCSGGGAVLQGPGCLNYTLVLKITEDGPLHSITSANRFIMEQNRAALGNLLSSQSEIQNPKSEISVCGHTDLAVGGLKFSGNAQRRKRRCLLFHGTFLLRFDIALVEKLLPMPSRQPDYRRGRAHPEFLTNLDVPADSVKRALRDAWRAAEPLECLPRETIALLARDKYATPEWNLKF
jgi:lipoate-protein ligase A